MPAYSVENGYSNTVSELEVQEYIIHKNTVAELKGMPGLYMGDKKADTLEIVLLDKSIQLEVRLFYTVFDEYNIIARNGVMKQTWKEFR